MTNRSNSTKVRVWKVTGWMNTSVVLTVEGGTLADSKREAKRLAENAVLPGRRTAELLMVL